MPSPFPGMNPYFEQPDVWLDFHERFLPLAAEMLNAQLGRDYLVLLDENLYIHDTDDGPRPLGRADVAVRQTGKRATGAKAAAGRRATPVLVRIPETHLERESFIEILDRRKREVVTVIELLSPTNKGRGANREQYLQKRHQLLNSQASFVEIDLLRGGSRMPFVHVPKCDY